MSSEASLRLPSQVKPLVTFAIFAYNQEKYIREAVKSAFEQTYQPLQIIVSDDCSTDGTFEILREMVDLYVGPHKIILNRNKKNMGLIPHVNYIFELADTEVLVVAAGDDISIPSRTYEIVNAFASNSRLFAIHSNATEIDDSGIILRELIPPVIIKKMKTEDMSISNSMHIGATAGYRKELYRLFGPITELNTYEDLIYGFRAAMLNGLGYIEKSLVHYRVNVGISSQFSRKNGVDKTLQRIAAIKHQLATLRQRKKDCNSLSCLHRESLLRAISKGMEYEKINYLFYRKPSLFIKLIFGEKKYIVLRVVLSEFLYRNQFLEKITRKIHQKIFVLR